MSCMDCLVHKTRTAKTWAQHNMHRTMTAFEYIVLVFLLLNEVLLLQKGEENPQYELNVH